MSGDDAGPTRSDFAGSKQKWLGHLAGLGFALLIAGSFSFGHIAAPYLSPAALNAARFLIAIATLATLHVILLGSLPGRPREPWRFAILGLLMATYFVLMFVALRLSSPVSTGAIFTLIPLMSAGFGWVFLKQTTSPLVFSSLLIAAAGAIWVIFRGDIETLLSFRIGKGEMIFFFGCAAHAAVAPLNRLFNRGEPGLYFALLSVTCTGVWVTALAAPDIAATDWIAVPAFVWMAIIYLAVFATAGTFFLVQFASMRLPASKVLSYGYITPAAIIFLEGLLGHGWTSWSVLAGAFITASALAVMAFAPDG